MTKTSPGLAGRLQLSHAGSDSGGFLDWLQARNEFTLPNLHMPSMYFHVKIHSADQQLQRVHCPSASDLLLR